MRRVRLVVLLALGLWLCGCATAWCPDSGVGLGNTCGQGSGDSSTSGNGTGTMYVSNSGASNLGRFAKATTVAGNVRPTASVSGALTQLSGPAFVTLDVAHDRLYVPNAGNNSIMVFDNIHQAVDNVPPTRFIDGANTGLSRPVQVVLDTTNDLMYVANAGNNSVLVFSSASTIQGSVAPTRTLSGVGTNITGLSSIHLDTANDRLWVVNPVSNSLHVFQPASTLNGGPPPVRTVAGSNTQMQSPQFILQVGSRLYISCTSSVVRFEGADAVSGDVAPAAVVNGTLTKLANPQQLVYRADADELYVADAGSAAVLVFPSASTAIANVPPLRTLQGSLTGFTGLTGLAIDWSR